jgi:hypothetical protein
MATNLPTSMTYIAEPARRGARKLRWSCMVERARGADERINRARMPIYLRRAAATHFWWSYERPNRRTHTFEITIKMDRPCTIADALLEVRDTILKCEAGKYQIMSVCKPIRQP